MNGTQSKQASMHKDFFAKTMEAEEHGFYLEAIFREYAAIEGRLERHQTTKIKPLCISITS